MKLLILVKHSLPEIAKSLPAREWILSEEGRRRARVLVDKLRFYQPEIIVASTEPKAMQSAEIVANELELEMLVAEDLHEHERGNAGFLSREVFERSVQQFFEKPDELIFGSESANQSYQRFRNAVNLVLKQQKNHTIAIVTHGTVISLFVSRLTNLPGFLLWKELALPSFIVLDLDSNTIVARENII